MFPCLESDHCEVANDTTLVCGANAGGPLCEVCDEGYVPDKSTSDGSCKVCAQSVDGTYIGNCHRSRACFFAHCQSIPSSPLPLTERWADKYLLILCGAVLYFVYALFVVTRPKPQLQLSQFLSFILLRVNLRRARKRAIERIFQRDQAAAEKPTMSAMQVADFHALLDAGRYDDVSDMRRSIYGAYSGGLAVDSVLHSLAAGGVGGGGAHGGGEGLLAHALQNGQAEHMANMVGNRAVNAVHDALGAPEDPDEQMRSLRVGGDEVDEGGDGDGDGGAGGVMDALGEAPGVDEARGAVEGGAALIATWARTARDTLKTLIEAVASAFSPGQLKVLMGNLQINASFTVVFDIPWPSGFANFLGFMDVFKLDIFSGLSFAAPCLHSTHR